MTITIRTTRHIVFEIAPSGILLRLPWGGEIFVDRTGQGLTCWSRAVQS